MVLNVLLVDAGKGFPDYHLASFQSLAVSKPLEQHRQVGRSPGDLLVVAHICLFWLAPPFCGTRIARRDDPNDVAKAMMVIAAVKVKKNNAIFTARFPLAYQCHLPMVAVAA
jgi:hypothetical protein